MPTTAPQTVCFESDPRSADGDDPRDAIRLLALTERISSFPTQLHFRAGPIAGQVAIVSLARLRQEFYGLAPVKSLLRARAGKEAIHEVGHTLGLVHCPDRTCAMSLSTNIRQVDIKRMEFCSSCDILVRESAKMIQKRPQVRLRGGKEMKRTGRY